MHFLFYRTNDVFTAEEKLQNSKIDVEILPTPVQDKAYCGICVKINEDDILKAKKVLVKMNYKVVK